MKVLDSILLVDDDEAANFFNKSLLNKLGVARDVVAAKDGREAFGYIEHSYYSLKQLPSLLLVDLTMPGMDGFEFIREVQHSAMLSVKNIPIAVLTISDSDKDKEKLSKLGEIKLVTKPLNEVKVFDILKETVLPQVHSDRMRKYINERHKELTIQMHLLKEQHKLLKDMIRDIKLEKEIIRQLKKKTNPDDQ